MNGTKGQKRYRDFPAFCRKVFGVRVQKLSVDAGFTCPNRDGKKGTGGCTFCNNESFNPDYCRSVESISSQLDEGIRFFDSKYKGQCYLAYFQAYSNTYAPLDVLRKRYEEALAHSQVAGIVIATRPDVMNEEILAYLEQLAREYYVCVEFGIESTDNAVLAKVNRGHTYEEAERAIISAADRGIYIGAHLIFGLPGETPQSMLDGAVRVSRLPIHILKLHQLQIIRGTRMADEYLNNPLLFRLYTLEEYLDFIADVIERMNPEVYLERFVNQAPPEYLIAPNWGVKNYEFVAKLDKRLKERDSWQGKWCDMKHFNLGFDDRTGKSI
ncbi:TIGR01212 family radical SAM protein [Odoribacter lunatus]|uniref:TIGR01212 family radical SAM protein n=1 Tax=Odoribacter lunatus TaxID=2941335 RepID=UPI00203D9728|nr:TIGR01212 family radical SAM protein [Odoribacter lunatus]